MTSAEKLLEKAKRAPNSFPFRELCALLEKAGFVCVSSKGSHSTYAHREAGRITITSRPSHAAPYQVRDAVEMIEEHGLLEKRE